MIGIVDYGSGNIQSIINAFSGANRQLTAVSTAEDIELCSRLVLPGVGAFDEVCKLLRESGLIDPLIKFAIEDKKPILGICVGFQIMALRSAEGKENGLGWFDAELKSFRELSTDRQLRVPHLGWNEIESLPGSPLFSGIDLYKGFYFIHSYYFASDNSAVQVGWANYGHRFCCAAVKENIVGVQFHPEKSHLNGRLLFENFLRM